MKNTLSRVLLALLLSISVPAFCGEDAGGLAGGLSGAISQGASTSKVAELIQQGADVNKPEQGVTPLMAAAALGQSETVKLLLQKGANPNVLVAAGGMTLSAFDAAVISGHGDTAKLLPAIGPDGKTLTGPAREQHLAQLTEAYQAYVVKAKLSKVVSTLDPLKTALTLYYQEQGFFPGKKETVDAAAAGKPLPHGTVWDAVGFSVYPVVPPEVASVTYVPFNVGKEGGAASFGLVITLRNIRPDTIDGLQLGVSPSDDMVITGPASATSRSGSFDSSALVFYYSCRLTSGHPVDPAVAQFFGKPGAPLVCI